jgi:hypothetical protein
LHTAFGLAQDRKNLWFAVYGHLHMNLLVHLAEKTLLPQPLTFGGITCSVPLSPQKFWPTECQKGDKQEDIKTSNYPK